MRTIIGNWKMYKTRAEAIAFIEAIKLRDGCRVALAVPYTLIQPCVACGKVMIGAQNMNDAIEGAFTGEISSRMILDVGAQFVLLGHSERRHLFGESDAFIKRKVQRALTDGLQPVLCIGETLAEQESGKTKAVLKRQLAGILPGVMVAYEPVWAIGTGKSATPKSVEEIHHYCRTLLPEGTELLYGGSVTPENAAALLAEANIDGLLVGGASLSVDSFTKIIQSATI